MTIDLWDLGTPVLLACCLHGCKYLVCHNKTALTGVGCCFQNFDWLFGNLETD